jgi:hypothetical protein
MEQAIDPVGVDRGKHRSMDRSDGARMAPRESDQILIGLFDGSKPLAKMRDCPFLEGDHRGH